MGNGKRRESEEAACGYIDVLDWKPMTEEEIEASLKEVNEFLRQVAADPEYQRQRRKYMKASDRRYMERQRQRRKTA